MTGRPAPHDSAHSSAHTSAHTAPRDASALDGWWGPILCFVLGAALVLSGIRAPGGVGSEPAVAGDAAPVREGPVTEAPDLIDVSHAPPTDGAPQTGTTSG